MVVVEEKVFDMNVRLKKRTTRGLADEGIGEGKRSYTNLILVFVLETERSIFFGKGWWFPCEKGHEWTLFLSDSFTLLVETPKKDLNGDASKQSGVRVKRVHLPDYSACYCLIGLHISPHLYHHYSHSHPPGPV